MVIKVLNMSVQSNWLMNMYPLMSVSRYQVIIHIHPFVTSIRPLSGGAAVLWNVHGTHAKLPICLFSPKEICKCSGGLQILALRTGVVMNCVE